MLAIFTDLIYVDVDVDAMMNWGVYVVGGFNFPLFQTQYTLPYPKTKE